MLGLQLCHHPRLCLSPCTHAHVRTHTHTPTNPACCTREVCLEADDPPPPKTPAHHHTRPGSCTGIPTCFSLFPSSLRPSWSSTQAESRIGLLDANQIPLCLCTKPISSRVKSQVLRAAWLTHGSPSKSQALPQGALAVPSARSSLPVICGLHPLPETPSLAPSFEECLSPPCALKLFYFSLQHLESLDIAPLF